ncbi:hypothetical protein PVAND_017111 [Polypedilum vanderplanki]|uniref:Uncharacterized protein n=1 Tax=Polypedilum vanderplanki TaxID=319348 RepID=A0A9J6BI62_POLVA|nr:hypothetical protein PVAND_017111 [Polypedilum vanderplanki]
MLWIIFNKVKFVSNAKLNLLDILMILRRQKKLLMVNGLKQATLDFIDEGFFYFIDRKKELLKYHNFQVTPSELEAIINEIVGVMSSCVVGSFKRKFWK